MTLLSISLFILLLVPGIDDASFQQDHFLWKMTNTEFSANTFFIQLTDLSYQTLFTDNIYIHIATNETKKLHSELCTKIL